MRIRLVQIDAFADRLFAGNPAAVMPLPQWPSDELLQSLAIENNLSETAFLVDALPPESGAAPEERAFHLRWFTPGQEVDLCGHATLATAAMIFEDDRSCQRVAFWTRSGWLRVQRDGADAATLDFPAETPAPVEPDPVVADALGVQASAALRATDLVWVVPDERTVRELRPDSRALALLPVRGVAVTARADAEGLDFVSRWFGGTAGIVEDPVTGSAHSQLAPYWADRLGRTELVARQLSARAGIVRCSVRGDRVLLAGTWRRYLDGVVELPEEHFSA